MTAPAQRITIESVWNEIIRNDFAARPIDDFSRAEISNTDSNVWDAFAQSMRSGFTVTINKSIYWNYLEALPPIFQIGKHFGFAEGYENVVHFWFVGDEETGQYFCRCSDILNPYR